MTETEITLLVLKAQSGDRAAYGELVPCFQDTVYATALIRVRNATEAQELTQEVFLHAMRKLPQLRNPSCFPGWLRRITKRMASNRLTRRSRVVVAETDILESVQANMHEPSSEIERSETTATVRTALAELKPMDREVLEEFYLRNRTVQEIAQDFRIPVGTVKRRLHTARKRIKEVLEDAEPSAAKPRKGRRRQLACCGV